MERLGLVCCLVFLGLGGLGIEARAHPSSKGGHPSSRPVKRIMGQPASAPTSRPLLPVRPPSALRRLLLRTHPLIDRAFQKNGYTGLSVGIIKGQRLVMVRHLGMMDRGTRQTPHSQTLYRIGSISKVLTTSLLVALRDKGKVRLDQPVVSVLPKGSSLPADPRGARAITFRHLATHTSGLPGLPHNLKGAPGDPYFHYTKASMLSALRVTLLDQPIGARYKYSNLGMALLGVALAARMKQPFLSLIKKHLLDPLGMKHTCVRCPAALQPMIATGYAAQDPKRQVIPWQLGAFVPAGGYLSTLADLAKWVSFQFRAGQAGVKPLSGGSLRELHSTQRLIGRRRPFSGGVGLGWHIAPIAKTPHTIVWHNGGVAGFRSYLGFVPKREVGVVVLTNTGRSVDRLGVQLLTLLARSLPAPAHQTLSARWQRLAQRVCREAVVAKPPAKLLKVLFAPILLQAFSVFRLQLVFGQIHTAFGPCQRVSWIPLRSPRSALGSFHFPKRKSLRFFMGLQPIRKGRIMSWRIFPPGKRSGKRSSGR